MSVEDESPMETVMHASWVLLAPFLAQGIIIGLDEGVFHLRRGLPRWERIGHPLDTLTVLACLAFCLLLPASSFHRMLYGGLALFSCIFVTKDEFVHKECCPAAEQWLHALLFLNHPILLGALGLLWCHRDGVELPSWLPLPDPTIVQPFLWGQALLVGLFLLYQVIYWNFLWRATPPSTTTSITP
jgi:hypothetical protein